MEIPTRQVTPKVVMPLRLIDVVVAVDPANRDPCLDDGGDFLPERPVEVAVAQDDDGARPFLSASLEQWPPFAVRVAVEEDSA